VTINDIQNIAEKKNIHKNTTTGAAETPFLRLGKAELSY
jgi:hypothetical protein